MFIDGARTATGLDALDWVRRGEDLGAGEIVVNSIDRDGTASGYDLEITRAVADAVNVPVIASGGAGTVDHIADGLTAGGAQAAIISSILYSPRLERNLGVRELKAGLERPRRPAAAVPRERDADQPSAATGASSYGTARGVGPQPVEVVVRTRLVEEHVHDDVSVVEQHPRSVVPTLDPDGLGAVVCARSRASTSSTIVRTWRVFDAADEHELVDDRDDRRRRRARRCRARALPTPPAATRARVLDDAVGLLKRPDSNRRRTSSVGPRSSSGARDRRVVIDPQRRARGRG